VRISVSAPGLDLNAEDHQSIERDLEKLSRRLEKQENATARVRLTGGPPANAWHAVLEVDYGKIHLVAKSDAPDAGQALRTAREEILRQVNDRTRRGHSSIAKHG
jgi:ribosome-associated translation inhibitor RaiA